MKSAHLTAVAALALTVFTAPSHAMFGDDEARKAILELREQLQSQQEAQLATYDRLDKLTRELQTLRGELDELRNSFGRERQRSESMLADLNSKFEKQDPEIALKQAAADREISAKQDLEAAVKLFQSQKYDSAVKSLSTFAQKYQDTQAYPESQYWLASCYYAKGQFSKAVTTATKMASSYPKHAKASEALLVAGMAQLDAKNPSGAKATFRKIVKLYPKSQAAKIAKSQL